MTQQDFAEEVHTFGRRDHGHAVRVLRDGVARRVCTCRIGRLGEQLLEVEPGNAASVAGRAPRALVPVGLFGEAQWHDVLCLVLVLAKGALQSGRRGVDGQVVEQEVLDSGPLEARVPLLQGLELRDDALF